MRCEQFITVGLNPCLDINCYVKNFKIDDIARIKEKRISAGGKAFNVAKFLNQYRRIVKPVGIAGGYNGGRFKSLLEKDKIPTEYLFNISGEIRENYNFFLKMVLY